MMTSRNSPVREYTKDDFQKQYLMGQGKYAKVYLVKQKQNSNLYALKAIKKSVIGDKDQLARTLTERRVLEKVVNPFIVRMEYAF